MIRSLLIGVAALLLGCAHSARWRSTPAAKPLTRAELSSRLLTVAPESRAGDPLAAVANGLRAALVQALSAEGFSLVAHPPYREDLQVTLTVEAGPGASVLATATLRSDDFFVEEVEEETSAAELADSAREAGIAKSLAQRLAASQGIAEFVRNSGTPAQRLMPN